MGKCDKIIINMTMPKTCGDCKFGMKTCSGTDFCFITRHDTSVDCRASTCPLEEIPQARKKEPLPKITKCMSCGSTSFNKRSKVDNPYFKYIECRNCRSTSEKSPGHTWREAISGWNALNSVCDER